MVTLRANSTLNDHPEVSEKELYTQVFLASESSQAILFATYETMKIEINCLQGV